jgi:hypothetical protein
MVVGDGANDLAMIEAGRPAGVAYHAKPAVAAAAGRGSTMAISPRCSISRATSAASLWSEAEDQPRMLSRIANKNARLSDRAFCIYAAPARKSAEFTR